MRRTRHPLAAAAGRIPRHPHPVSRAGAMLASLVMLVPFMVGMALNSPTFAAESDALACGCVGDFKDPASIRAALNEPVEPGADGLSADGTYRLIRDELAETAVLVRVADEEELFDIVINEFTLGFGFSPDGGRFVVYGATTRMFDLEDDGREILTLDDHDVTLGFSPDGRFALARWVEDMTDIKGRVFDAKTGDVIRLQGAETINGVDGVGFGPGSSTFWVGTPTTSHIYRTSDWSVITERNVGPTTAVFFSPFGEFIQMVTTEGTQVELWIIRASDGSERYRTQFDAQAPAPGPGGSSDRGATKWGFSPDGRSFSIVSRVAYDAQLRIANLETGEETVNVTGLEWSPVSGLGTGFSPCGEAFALTSELSGHAQTAVYSPLDGSILGETLLDGSGDDPFDGSAITVRATESDIEAVENGTVHRLGANLICAIYQLSALEEVPGGAPATVTVMLDRPAPVGGYPLVMTSNSPLVQVPGSVVVPAGETSVAVEVSTSRPVEDTAVTLSIDLDVAHMTSRGPSSVTVTVMAPKLWYLSINNWLALEAGPGSGEIFLQHPAPAGGVPVTLSADDDVLELPTTVTVEEGERSATFDFVINESASDREVTVTAGVGGSTVTLLTTVIAGSSTPGPEGAPTKVPNVTISEDASGYTLDWGTPDNGGSPITSYLIRVEENWDRLARLYLDEAPERNHSYFIRVSAATHSYRGHLTTRFPNLRGESTLTVTAFNNKGEGPRSDAVTFDWRYQATDPIPTPEVWPPTELEHASLVASPDEVTDLHQIAAGDQFGIEGEGFTPGEPVALAMYSLPTHLGDTKAGADGSMRAIVTIPEGTQPGIHTIVATGVTSNHQRILPLRVPVTIGGPGELDPDDLPFIFEPVGHFQTRNAARDNIPSDTFYGYEGQHPAMSHDGRFVLTNEIVRDPETGIDMGWLYLHDTQTGEKVVANPSVDDPERGPSFRVSGTDVPRAQRGPEWGLVSGDGSTVVFTAPSPEMPARPEEDGNATRWPYRYDVASKTVTPFPSPGPGHNFSGSRHLEILEISTDGTRVLLSNTRSGLGLFLADFSGEQPTMKSLLTDEDYYDVATMSGDGRFLMMVESLAQRDVIRLYDMTAGTASRPIQLKEYDLPRVAPYTTPKRGIDLSEDGSTIAWAANGGSALSYGMIKLVHCATCAEDAITTLQSPGPEWRDGGIGEGSQSVYGGGIGGLSVSADGSTVAYTLMRPDRISHTGSLGYQNNEIFVYDVESASTVVATGTVELSETRVGDPRWFAYPRLSADGCSMLLASNKAPGAETAETRAFVARCQEGGGGPGGPTDPGGPGDPVVAGPEAIIGGPTVVQEGFSTTLTATASTGTGPLSYAWSLGDDGEFDDGTDPFIEIDAPTFGDITVHLRVTDGAGESSTTTQTVSVENVAPIVAPIADQRLDDGDALIVSGSFTDPGENAWTGMIDFGDGPVPLVLDGKTFAINENAPRAGLVTVTICDDGDACGSATFRVSIGEPAAPPTIVIEGPTAVVQGDTVTYSAAVANMLRLFATTADDVSFAWDTNGDGSFDDGTGATMEVTFTAPGTHVIAVQATSLAGTSTASLEVSVSADDDDGVTSPGDETDDESPVNSGPSDETSTRLPATGGSASGGMLALTFAMLALGLAILARRGRQAS